MWLLVHLICFIVLVPVTIIGLTRTSEKRIAQWLIFDRTLYILILISGTILFIRTVQFNPLLIILKAALGLAVIAFIEIAFGRKQERRLSTTLITLLTLVGLVTAILGLWLVWGR